MTVSPAEVHVQRAAEAEVFSRPNRPSLRFRDLGLASATEGRMSATLVRAIASSTDAQDQHRHDVDLQFYFVIAGHLTVEHEGITRVLTAGDAVVQPSGVVHRIIEHSADLELLEVSSPSEFETEIVS